MNLLKKHAKKILASLTLAIALLFSLSAPLRAATSTGIDQIFTGGIEQILKDIRTTTNNILLTVNEIPARLDVILAFLQEFTKVDDSKHTANQASQAAILSIDNKNVDDEQLAQQDRIVKDLLRDATATNLSWGNDLTYQTLLNKPYFKNDPRNKKSGEATQSNTEDSAYNYIKNAAGLGMIHEIPQGTGSGSVKSQLKYISFYNTTIAIQSYNGYLLSQLYAQYKKGKPFSATQQALITQASSTQWFLEIANQSLGWVMRQILFYNSQIYILAARLLETQNKMLAAQAMTNSLLILANQSNEDIMYQRAIGKIPD